MSEIIFRFNLPKEPSEMVDLLFMQVGRATVSSITGEPKEQIPASVINTMHQRYALFTVSREYIPYKWIEGAEALVRSRLVDCGYEYRGEVEKPQPDAAYAFAQARIELLERLVTNYYTLLRVVSNGYWLQVMTPFWNSQREKLQVRAEELGITDEVKCEVEK